MHMMSRALPLVLAILALALLAGMPALAEEKEGTHAGIVVKVGDGKLTRTDKDGKKEHSHEVARDAKITCEGKECKLDDLQKGFRVRVTVEKKDGKQMATRIDAKKTGS